MLREITLGQFYPADSILHKLDPRVKIMGTLFFIVSMFIFDSWQGYLLAAFFLAVMIKISRVPFSFMVKGLKAVVILILITAVFNLLFTHGEPLFSFWRLTVTKEGVKTAVKMMLRLCFLILGSSVMTLTTTPKQLTDGIEKLLSWLRIFKVPVHEIAMMMSIALSFIPILTEETDKIMKAQMARGANFESGNIIKKAEALVPLLVPLFVSAFRRANDLALAMEARCYRGGEGRTKMKPLVYKRRDRVAYLVLYAYLGAVIALRILFG
ncbi:MAG: energy-coupling factor transporter transmembrane protein EcfT [Lachnospiraceae bacterium]|nr:energy-coupling factor transporter transmembrane protein EcfT [Lachnospiraceae bacterium]